jgi:nucleotide-binding universal stress UspA family protein
MSDKPIIVGVDDSPESARAARMGWHLAAAKHVPCRLIHAIPDVWVPPDASVVPLPPGFEEAVVAEARGRMRDWLTHAVPEAGADALEIHVGRAAHVLAEAAVGAQLVVLGGKTHGPLARGLGGSTAHYLVRSIDAPVLIVSLTGWPVRRVLAAVDLSFAANPTIAAARQFARDTSARLRLLHAVEPVHAPRVFASRIDPDAVHQAALENFHRATTGITELQPGDRVMRRGPAAETIAEDAAAWEADVVVLPASLLVVPLRPAERPPDWPAREVREPKGMIVI